VTDERLAKLGEIVEHHLNRIRGVYVDPQRVRLTLLIRDTAQPDGSGDYVATDDDEVEALVALTRRFEECRR
jgi:hypothetical protein